MTGTRAANPFNVLEHVIQDDGYDRLYVPLRIAHTWSRALRRVVEYGQAIAGNTWRWEVIERPWRTTEIRVIWMRQGAENTEPGWWQDCAPDEDGAEPFWQVWT